MTVASFFVPRFAHIRKAGIFLALIVIGLSQVHAADGGKVEPVNLPAVTKARDAFDAAVKKARDDLAQALDSLLENAKDDVGKTKRIEADKQEWIKSGKLPACCQTTKFEDARERASTELMGRFAKAVTDLKAQADDANAAKVQSELDALMRAHEAYRWRDRRWAIRLPASPETPSAWSWQDGALTESSPGPHHFIVPIYPADTPSGYKIDLSVRRTKGSGELQIVLPAASDALSDPALLRLEAPLQDGPASGLAWIDGKAVEENPTKTKTSVFLIDKAASLHIEVTPERISVKQGETSLIDWDCTKGAPAITPQFRGKHPEIIAGSMVVITSGESTFCVDSCASLLVPNTAPNVPRATPKPAPKAKELPPDLLEVGTEWHGTWNGNSNSDEQTKCTAQVKSRNRVDETATIAITGPNGGVTNYKVKTHNNGASFSVLDSFRGHNGAYIKDAEGSGTVVNNTFTMDLKAHWVDGGKSWVWHAKLRR